MSTSAPGYTPQAFAALEAFPALHAAVAASLQRQAARAVACLGRFVERPSLLATLARAASDPRGGLVVLEGPPGSGVTSLLVALAARSPMPLWLADDDAGGGLAALYAQIVALRRPDIPLIDPSVPTDPGAIERLLADLAAAGGAGGLTLLIDLPDPAAPPARPAPLRLPSLLPPGVTLVLGCPPGAALPTRPRERIRLPEADPQLGEVAGRALDAARCPPAAATKLIAAAQGNLLYLELAAAWLAEGLIDPAAPPTGLAGLLDSWWRRLDLAERRIALLLAAAGEPLPLTIIGALLDSDPEPALNRWEALHLIDLSLQAATDRPHGLPELLALPAHSALRRFLAQTAPDGLTEAHDSLARLAAAQTGSGDGYLARQLARHAGLGAHEGRAARLAPMTTRDKLRGHERRGELPAALQDALWELHAAAADGPPLRLVRATALAGNLATRARSLSGDSAVEALNAGFAHGGREAALKRVLELVERLPDGLDKAQILRKLGETCYGARMRSSAMRLLSRALDLEAQPTSRGWRDQRDQLLAALATAAIGLDSDIALAIAERIEHLERRAAVETAVARQMIAGGDLERARRVARGVLHESMGAWARAEVAVALARAGDTRGDMIIEEISLETVSAWAQIELACDLAAHDQAAAHARLAGLSPGQRDRGLARLAQTLAAAQQDGDALAAAEQIVAVETRVAALLDLRRSLEGLVAMLALERATSDIGALTGDDRAPLLAALAAAHAAIGRKAAALAITAQLPAGEERDRALAKVAVALAQGGDHASAQAILAGLEDDDERDWAYDEIARMFARAGSWDAAGQLAEAIRADEQRARTGADLAIMRARAGDQLGALAQAALIERAGDRARALTIVAPLLVAAGAIDQVMAVLESASALSGAEARGRYMAAVAGALAEVGRYDDAAGMADQIDRPNDRARAGLALAVALAQPNRARAESVLGQALRAAAIGREEALRAIEIAAPLLATIGGARLLAGAAAAIDEVDSWF
jgi:hypothetical protein